MDSEHTDGVTEPCAQCEAVDWGVSDEGRFFCRTCHHVSERQKEAEPQGVRPGVSRVSHLSRGGSGRRRSVGRQWSACEAFQFILRAQADALLGLGVSGDFRDDVLLRLWRLFLQLSQQAYTSAPLRSATFRLGPQDSGSEQNPEVSTDDESSRSGGSRQASCSSRGSSGADDDATALKQPAQVRMSKTLALVHLALVWCREPLTLSDLLRLVSEGHVPYVSAHEGLPEDLVLEGPEVEVFRVKDVPSYRVLHREAQALTRFLRLPVFPPVGCRDPLHPAPLVLRYMTEVNLPDELHPWACGLLERAGLMKVLAFDPGAGHVLPQYDLQAAAAVIVTLRLLFGLDDHTEWELSDQVQDQDSGVFSFRRWYHVLQGALLRARRTHRCDLARRRWRSRRLLCSRRKSSAKIRQTTEHIQTRLQKLSGRAPGPRPQSSFRFLWGDRDGADGPSMHLQRLGPVVSGTPELQTPTQTCSWFFHPKPSAPQVRNSWDVVVDQSLPASLLWLLDLFCFLLQVQMDLLYPAVLKLERRVFKGLRPAGNREAAETRTRTRTSSSTSSSS